MSALSSAPSRAWIRWPGAASEAEPSRRLAYGGDYNPEQWPRATWAEDMRLMQAAGVNLVTVGVFAWAKIQPAPDRWEFGWLDDVLDLLHEHGIAVDLATATASAPPWLAAQYPEMLPVDYRGHRLAHVSRQTFCPSSPIYREHSLALTRAVAERYRDHPALALWHISNELGCHNIHCYCAVSSEHFRAWLQDRYGSVEKLNDAWSTSFWSLGVGEWSEVVAPSLGSSFANPTQQLDFLRFSSDAVRGQLQAEASVLRSITPEVPITTNFMLPLFKDADYAGWARDVDLVSNDHYLTATDPRHDAEVAYAADLTRGVARGQPWLLMEQSTSAVSWQPVNTAKRPGQLRRNSLAQVARGSDGICFFQWRQSRGGAEKFHSAMLPHAGTDSALWRDVVALGADLHRLDEVAGSTVVSDAAVLFDWGSWWAGELDAHPSSLLDYRAVARSWHQSLFDLQLSADVVVSADDLARYRVVVVPMLYLVGRETAAALARYVLGGGHLLVTYFSGIVDPNDQVLLGGYPGAFRDLLGVRTEEFAPLLAGDRVRLEGGVLDGATGAVWSERAGVTDAAVVSSFADGPAAGSAALTRVSRGDGSAWYLTTELDAAGRAAVLRALADAGGLTPMAEATEGVEVVRRRRDGVEYLFAINHTDAEATVFSGGHDLLTARTHGESSPVPPGGAVVLRRALG